MATLTVQMETRVPEAIGKVVQASEIAATETTLQEAAIEVREVVGLGIRLVDLGVSIGWLSCPHCV